MQILETHRLILREMTLDDAQNIYELNIDPEVTRYTGDEAFKSVKDAQIFLQNYKDYEKYGLGRWAVETKETKEFLGFCGLKFIQQENQHDIGFRFMKKYWGKGYATESAKACLELGFNKFNLKLIIGRAAKQNLASIQVLKKIGMLYLKDEDCHGQDAEIYQIKNSKLF